MKLLIFLLPIACFAQWSDLGTNTKLNTAKFSGSALVDCAGSTPPSYCTGSGANYAFATSAHYVLDAWGGAAADTVNNRLIITGGGHTDYNGNQVYILDLTTNVMSIDLGPTGNYSTMSGTEANGDGTPTARHSYAGLVYLPNENSVFYWGDGNAPGGTRSANIWWYGLSTHTWTEKGAQPDNVQDQVVCQIDPTQAAESLLCIGEGSYIMWRYVPGTDTWTALNSTNGTLIPFEANCAIQPDLKVEICVGATSFGASAGIYSIDITGAASYAAVNITSSTTGCSALYSANFPGIDYDASTGLLIYYSGSGNSITTFDAATNICQTRTFSGGPTASGASQGILSKFAYFPKLNRHIVVNNAAADSFSLALHPNGLGHSVVTSSGPCLDVDGDGYGVGAGCSGPDADDGDATVHTAAQVISLYGSMDAFLQHIGYQNGSSRLTVYCIAITGNDSTGASSTNADTACTNPYLTWSKIAALTAASPSQNYIVLYRGGTWTANIGGAGGVSNVTSGTNVVQNVIMSYPGEQAIIDLSGGTQNAFWMAAVSYVTVDGFRVKGNANGGGYFGGTFIVYQSGDQAIHFIGDRLLHCEISGAGNDSNVNADNILDFTAEENVTHDPYTMGGQHNIYLGSNTVASAGVNVSRNILYNVFTGGYPSLQFNGRCTWCRFEQNMIYNSDGQAAAWLDGVSHSFFRGNQIWNTGIAGNGSNRSFTIYNYDSSQCKMSSVPSICPWDQTANVIENNTTWVGTQGVDGSGSLPTSYAFIIQQSATVGPCGSGSPPCGNLGGNSYRNNIIVALSSNGNADAPVYYSSSNSVNYLALDTWTNNIIRNAAGFSTFVASEGGTGLTCSTFNSAASSGSGCSTSDPLFTAASISYYNAPQSFNFSLLPSSPAIGAGIATGAPNLDIFGAALTSPPSIGSIATASPPPPTPCPTDAKGWCITGLSSVQNNLLGPLIPYGASPWVYGDLANKGTVDYMVPIALAEAPVLGTALAGTFSFSGGNTLTTTSDLRTPLSGVQYIAVAWNSVDGAGTGRLICPISSVTINSVVCSENESEPSFSGVTGYIMSTATDSHGCNFTCWTTENPSSVWNYYDVSIALYRLYYRTGNVQYRTWARQFADIQWQWVLDHGYRAVAPRASALLGQFFRVGEGNPERLPGLYNLISLYIPAWATNGDLRESGYVLWGAADGAKIDTDATRHTQYCSWLSTYTASPWIANQNADGSWSENEFALNSSYVSAPKSFTPPFQYQGAPWREAINIKSLEAAYESLNDTSGQGCNNTSLAATTLTAITSAVTWQNNYGRDSSNRGDYYEVNSQSNDQASISPAMGTVSVSLSSTSVLGSGTNWNTAGYCDGTHFIGFFTPRTVYKIASCSDNTHATLTIAFGLYGEMSNVSGDSFGISPSASTACNSSATYCYTGTGDRNLTRTNCGGIGWLYNLTLTATYKNWGDECYSATLGGPSAGLNNLANLGGVTLPCSGPLCDGLVTDVVMSAANCNDTGNVPPCLFGVAFGNLGKNYGEAFGAPGIDNELAWRLSATPPTGTSTGGNVTFGGIMTQK